MAENATEEAGNVYFDVPGGISSQYQFDNTIDPYSYAPVHSSYGIGSLIPIGYDQTQYAPLETDYQSLRGVGESTPYDYNQYLTWGPSAYETEIVTGYDNFGNPIIERPGSSIPMQGYDDVEGYNWDLLPEHGPFYTDSPLVNPGMNAPSGEFVNSGVANVDMGIPGVLLGLHNQPYNNVSPSSAAWRPSGNPDLWKPGVGGVVPATLSGGVWQWNPEAKRRVRTMDRNSNSAYSTEYGDWGFKRRDGTWTDSEDDLGYTIVNREALGEEIWATRPANPYPSSRVRD